MKRECPSLFAALLVSLLVNVLLRSQTMISAPTRLTVWLIDCGARSPASRTISKSSVTQSISSIGGSGVDASPCASLVKSRIGMISGAKATAMT